MTACMANLGHQKPSFFQLHYLMTVHCTNNTTTSETQRNAERIIDVGYELLLSH